MMTNTFWSDAKLERMANGLLTQYEARYGPIDRPPVPVERILEDVLDLSILWDNVPEEPGQSILAGLDPNNRTVVFNEVRLALIEETPGLYNTVLAHEAGHWEAHVDAALLNQTPLPQFDREFGCLYRGSGLGGDPRERQAHQFMGFLLMPSHLLREAIRDVDLLNWQNLYALRELFQVTITALTVRLGPVHASGAEMLPWPHGDYRSSVRTHCTSPARSARQRQTVELASAQRDPLCRRAGLQVAGVAAPIRQLAYRLHSDEPLVEEWGARPGV